jgi:hypothetical protein
VKTRDKEESERGLEKRVDDLRAELLTRDPTSLAHNTGAVYADGHFRLDIWNRPVIISEHDFVAIDEEEGTLCDVLTQAMLAYYFHTSDGNLVNGEWISFRELPDGQFYATAFQGYTGDKLATIFGDDIEAFVQAADEANGRRQPFGDAAFYFQALPRVPVAIVCWLGDEDFLTSYRILFDDSVNHHLPTDACAILGSMLTRKLIKIKNDRGRPE